MEYVHTAIFGCPKCHRPIPVVMLIPEIWPDEELDQRKFSLRCEDPRCGWKGELPGTQMVSRDRVEWPYRREPVPA